MTITTEYTVWPDCDLVYLFNQIKIKIIYFGKTSS